MALHPYAEQALMFLLEAEVERGEHKVVLIGQRHGHESRRTGCLTRDGEAQIRRGLKLLGAPKLQVAGVFSSPMTRATGSLFVGLQSFANGDSHEPAMHVHRDFGYGVWEDLGVTKEDLRPTKERLIANARGEHRNVTSQEWIDAWPNMAVLRQQMRLQIELMLVKFMNGKKPDPSTVHVIHGVGHSCSLEIGLPADHELDEIQMLECAEMLITTWIVDDLIATQVGRTNQLRIPRAQPRK